MTLPTKEFPDFEDAKVSWKSFCDDVEDFEYNQYNVAISIVSRFKDKTVEVINTFRLYVINNSVSADDADIILSTVQAAKGMEWENVQLCNDFGILSRFDQQGKKYKHQEESKWKMVPGKWWQFSVSEYSDNLNILYVACTRARSLLSIPKTLIEVYKDFDAIQAFINKQCHSPAMLPAPPRLTHNGVLNLELIKSFYEDLLRPFQKAVVGERFCLDRLVQDDLPAENDNDAVATFPSEEGKQKLFSELAKVKTPKNRRTPKRNTVQTASPEMENEANRMDQWLQTATPPVIATETRGDRAVVSQDVVSRGESTDASGECKRKLFDHGPSEAESPSSKRQTTKQKTTTANEKKAEKKQVQGQKCIKDFFARLGADK